MAIIIFIISVGVINAVGLVRGKKAERKALETDENSAVKTASKMMVVSGATERMTQDAVVELLGSVKSLLMRIEARMDADEKEEELAELERRMLQRLKDELKPSSS